MERRIFARCQRYDGIASPEKAMWICRHCGMAIPIGAADPQEDSEGFYFACPGCEGKNRLTSTGEGDDQGGAGLTQPDV
jgi:hypothetical protein